MEIFGGELVEDAVDGGEKPILIDKRDERSPEPAKGQSVGVVLDLPLISARQPHSLRVEVADRRGRRGHQLLQRLGQQIGAAGRLVGHQLVQRAEGLSQLERRGLVGELRQRGGERREVVREEPVPGGAALVVVEQHPAQPLHVARAERLEERAVQAVARLPAELLAVVAPLPALLAQPDRVLHAVVRVSLLPLLQELQGEAEGQAVRNAYSISIFSRSALLSDAPLLSFSWPSSSSL